MIRVSELKQTEINIVFYEKEREDATGPRDRESAEGEIAAKDSWKEKYLKIMRMRQTRRDRGAKKQKRAEVIAGQMLLSRDTGCWLS